MSTAATSLFGDDPQSIHKGMRLNAARTGFMTLRVSDGDFHGKYMSALISFVIRLASTPSRKRRYPGSVRMEIDQEADGRWLSETPDPPGVMAYFPTVQWRQPN